MEVNLTTCKHMSRDISIDINLITLGYIKPDTYINVDMVEFRYVQRPKDVYSNICRSTDNYNSSYIQGYIERYQSKYIYLTFGVSIQLYYLSYL